MGFFPITGWRQEPEFGTNYPISAWQVFYREETKFVEVLIFSYFMGFLARKLTVFMPWWLVFLIFHSKKGENRNIKNLRHLFNKYGRVGGVRAAPPPAHTPFPLFIERLQFKLENVIEWYK